MDTVRPGIGTWEVGVIVQLGAYIATVHYKDCYWWKNSMHKHTVRTIPPSVKWRLCSFCKPQREDIALVAGEITWLEKHADVMSLPTQFSLTDAEEEMLSHEGEYGRRKTEQGKFSDR